MTAVPRRRDPAGPPDPRTGELPQAVQPPQTLQSPQAVQPPRQRSALALVESPVQLLNLLEWAHAEGGDLTRHTVAVLPPRDPMGRGQLLRMASMARDEGLALRWCEPRAAAAGPLRTLAELAPALAKAECLVIGDPFSRMVQALLPLSRARDLVVVDDGTATMEFVALMTDGRRLVRWHRSGRGRGGLVDTAFAPVARYARRRLTARAGRAVELFTALPVTAPPGVVTRVNHLAWTRERFGPPTVRDSADVIGTSLVETGVVDRERYLAAVAGIARLNGATRYFAHRRENGDKLRELAARTGLEIVRPDLPLELIARRGPIGARMLSFPSTVVHTLPAALAGTGVQIEVCDVEPSWLTAAASPRAHGFLTSVNQAARARHGLRAVRTARPPFPDLPDSPFQAVPS
ncbi:hypothetical protein [Streptantibioticus silvisoli]|uniref:Uncharacterized protein n=1 Tax=Streptantibioticus silvisoli TaxID=2705255 RepID=A0ABT6W9U3_9ACTN|nr:hypothetical protein [Streptantibioticus silvisoli]MDI5967520.1 hypothetical protein [Streptantibioticus silvisoli]